MAPTIDPNEFWRQVLRKNKDYLNQISAEQLHSIDPKTGRTLLSRAVTNANYETMLLLLNKEGVDPNIPDTNGMTPLIRAARINNVGVIRALLMCNNIDICVEDNMHRNALWYADEIGLDGTIQLITDALQEQAKNKKIKLMSPASDSKLLKFT